MSRGLSLEFNRLNPVGSVQSSGPGLIGMDREAAHKEQS
jgi:hypothetical protein